MANIFRKLYDKLTPAEFKRQREGEPITSKGFASLEDKRAHDKAKLIKSNMSLLKGGRDVLNEELQPNGLPYRKFDLAKVVSENHGYATTSTLIASGGAGGTGTGYFGGAGGSAGISSGLVGTSSIGRELTDEEIEKFKREMLGKFPDGNTMTQPLMYEQDVPEWKLQVMNSIFSRLSEKETHKHPNPDWKFFDCIERLFPDVTRLFGGTSQDTFTRWLCSSEKTNKTNYKLLFADHDFAMALFGDSGMKMDCDCGVPCSCPGKTVLEYAEDELRGEEPFEYLRSYMQMD